MARGTLGEQFGIFGKSTETIGVRIIFEGITEIETAYGIDVIESNPSITINAGAFDTIAEVMARANEYAREGRLGERHGGSPKMRIVGSKLTGLILGGFTDPAIRMA